MFCSFENNECYLLKRFSKEMCLFENAKLLRESEEVVQSEQASVGVK